MEDEKFFETLDKIPELIKKVDKLSDAVAQNNKATTDNVAIISRTVAGQNERQKAVEKQLTTLTNSIDSAKNQMQKEVIVQVEPADVHITQRIPGWVEDMGKEYNDLKRQALSRKERKVITIGPKFFKYIAMFACAVLAGWVLLFFYWEYKRNNSAEAYAERAYNAAVACGVNSPEDYYHTVRRKWNDETENMKDFVERTERKVNLYSSIKANLSGLYEGKELVIRAVENSGNDIIALWNFVDEEPDYIAHFWPDGKIDIADTKQIKITSLKDAHRLSKHKAWQTIRASKTTE